MKKKKLVGYIMTGALSVGVIGGGSGMSAFAASDASDTTESTTQSTTALQGGDFLQSEPKDSILDVLNQVTESKVTQQGANEVKLANKFLSTLTDEQKSTVQYEFTEENAAHWTNLPANSQNRNGVALGDLSNESVKAALKLAKASLSKQGYETLTEIIKADEFLTTDTGRTEWGSGLYYIAILGTPSENGEWMLQISGHHLAENIVFDGKEEVSATPQFTGSEPQTFELDGTTYSPIETRRDGMYSILESLTTNQLNEAKISETFRDVVVGADKDGQFPEESEGILYTDLTKNQQKLVQKAIKAWVKDADSKTANKLLKAYLSKEALSKTYIGWSGSTDYNEVGSYGRVRTQRLSVFLQ
ncbi:DUF3500 domain-containing protein [Priestia filamentosa]|uniref:DUF3500 domain-containing protein n=1 Tax=Priestia filamentosa TaxID=1402861 RepID=UPI000A0887D1|nr:DUF3500 domain-containing protein [Priestia filamentosa]MDT3762156.1 DUF3500 domain-containing protein [Priestia filamentosa]WRU96647.1 DUF3500 domain-containing protein [Priestia filamentosa]SMF62351.1 Protein of unknown function [Priestia filamentosa]